MSKLDIKINRKPHKLKHNSRSETMHHILFLDTESNITNITEEEQLHTFKLGCAIFYRLRKGEYHEEKRFSSTRLDEFWGRILQCVYKKTTLYVFAHNMHYDFNILQTIKYMHLHHFELLKFIIDSNRFMITFRCRKTGRKIVFLDSTNYMMISIEAIGKMFNMPKMHVDFERCSIDELKTYCFRDVEIMAKWILTLIEFIKREDLGKVRFTIASQALQAFRHRFMHHDIYLHANEEITEMEYLAYRGGLNDCFRIGKIEGAKLFKLDVNSMYPYVMKVHDYPVKLVKLLRDADYDQVRKVYTNHLFIVDCLVEAKNTWIPLKYNNKLMRLKGKFRAVLTSPELDYYMDKIKIIKTYRIAIYEKAPIFTEYVDYFYNKKEESARKGDAVRKTLYKLFLNSLYGKFAQRIKEIKMAKSDKSVDNIVIDYIIDEMGKRITLRYIGQNIFYDGDTILGYDSYPAIASFVTAYARVYLHQLINTAKEENVYYVDTDSLIVNESGFTNLIGYINDFELGKLKIEGATDKVVINGCKDYIFNGEVKLKGVNKKARQIGINTYQQVQFLKTRTLWRKGIMNGVITKYNIKTLKRKYDKGVVDESGVVHPYILQNINLLEV